MSDSIRFAVATLVLMSCAPPPASRPVSEQVDAPASLHATETGVMVRLNQESGALAFRVDAPSEKVWAQLPAIYATLGIPVEARDGGAFGTRSFTQSRIDGRRTGEFVRCGNEGAGPSSGGMYRTRLTILSSLRNADPGTWVRTEISGTATPVEGTSTGAASCTSTGALEQRIRALLLERLAR